MAQERGNPIALVGRLAATGVVSRRDQFGRAEP
jgi:hypothetical protein